MLTFFQSGTKKSAIQSRIIQSEKSTSLIFENEVYIKMISHFEAL